jgi:hypothetical protein
MPTAAFFRRGITQVVFCPTIGIKATPTMAELTAGTNLTATGNVADMAGFSFTNSPIDTPDMSSVFNSKIPGEDQTEDSTMTFYEPKTGTDASIVTLAKGTAGFIVIFYRGFVGASHAVADKCEVWPVVSTGPARQYGMDATAAKWMTTLTPSSPPSTNAAVIA